MLPLEAEHDIVLLHAAGVASIYSQTHVLLAWAGKQAFLLATPSLLHNGS